MPLQIAPLPNPWQTAGGAEGQVHCAAPGLPVHFCAPRQAVVGPATRHWLVESRLQVTYAALPSDAQVGPVTPMQAAGGAGQEQLAWPPATVQGLPLGQVVGGLCR